MWWDSATLKARNVILKSGTITMRPQRQVGSTEDALNSALSPVAMLRGALHELGKVCI